eukprot:TRINITY_DN35301_c0_g1_i1.p1 TRINITY_DN35301_c0_g1~~TRINITY_DN35301_c0_g1_i1.p1  ORF type:complete len:638 (+),score=271.34 TRINITY_DN35301_c0_g1_i1:40-1914(+)
MAELNQRLKTCCRVGDVVGLRQLLEKGAAVDSVDPKQKQDVTGLWLAAEAGKTAIFDELLSHGADVNFKRPKDDASVLYVACQNGHTPIVTRLLDHPKLTSVDQKKTNGSTPLFISAQQGHPDTARMLLKRGANANVKNDQDVTAFILACYTGNEELAVLLLSYGADPYTRRSGQTGLELAKAMKFHKVVAAVHHYVTFVQPMSLLSGFVISFFQKWLAAGYSRTRTGDDAHHTLRPHDELEASATDQASTAYGDDSALGGYSRTRTGDDAHHTLRPHDELEASATDQASTAYGDDSALGWSLRDLPEGAIDYEPLQLSGGVGNRLRPVIVPGTLRPESDDEGDAESINTELALHRTLYGYDYADTDSGGSSVFEVPSVTSDGEEGALRGYRAFPATHNLPSTHRYMRRLENAYEAEFGKAPGTFDFTPKSRGSRTATQQSQASAELRRRKHYQREVDDAFRAIFPSGVECDKAKGAYYNQDIQLTRTLHCAANGKGRNYGHHTSISHAMATGRYNGPMVNEHRNMKAGARSDTFLPAQPFKRVDAKAKWKKKLTDQQSREQEALRQAQAKAVTAKIEKQVLEETIASPGLLSSINRGDKRLMSRSRDTTCDRLYQDFHKREFE